MNIGVVSLVENGADGNGCETVETQSSVGVHFNEFQCQANYQKHARTDSVKGCGGQTEIKSFARRPHTAKQNLAPLHLASVICVARNRATYVLRTGLY